MAEPPNGDHNSGNHYFNYGTQGFSSTMPMDNLFDFTEDVDMSVLFDLLEYQPPTNNTPSSLMENVVPNHQNPIEIGGPSDNQNTLEVQDDYSLSYIFSMGTKNVALLQEEGGEITSNGDGIEQENPKTNDLTTNQPMPKTPILVEQENPRTNDLMTNQPMPKTPILEEHGNPRTNDLITNQPMPKTPILEEHGNPRTNDLIPNQPTPKVPILEEQENPSTNAMILQQPMPRTPILEEQENPKTSDLITNQPTPRIPTLEEQENPRTNAMILQQQMPRIPSVEELESDFIASRMEQENPRNNDMVLQQHMPTIPYLLTEKERDFITRRREQEKSGRDSMKPKLTTDHPYGISTSTRKEQENPKINGLILQQPMPTIPCLLKAKERNFMNSKYTTGTSTRREQETPKTNDMILNPPVTTIPSSEKKESDFLRPKMTNIHPFRINSWREKQTPKTNNLILNTTLPRLPTLEKKKSEHMKSKLINTNSPYGISTTRDGKCNLLGIGTGKTTWNAYFGSRTTHKDDESRYGVLNSFDNQLQVQLPQKTSSSSGGPIRRSPNQTSSRYQPFGRQISNNQGSNFSQSSLESTFNRSQAADGSVVCDIGKLWKNQRREIKRKIGIASYYAGSSNIHRQIWNNLQKRSLSPQVAEIEKRNSNGEDLIGGKSSKKDNHSMLQNLPNQNFQHSPANSQEIITNQINTGTAGGQSMTNQGTSYYSTESSQSWGYAQGISLGNEYGAQLQQGGYYAMETGNEIMDAQYSGFQATVNEITDVQSSGFQAMGNEITDVQSSGFQAVGNEITNVQSSGFQAMGNEITDLQYSGVQATGKGIMDVQSSGFQVMGNEIMDVQYSGFQAAENGITEIQYSGFQATGNEITDVQYSGVQATGNGIMDVQYSGVQATGNGLMEVQYSGYAQGISGSQSFNPEETHLDVTNWQFGDESQGNL
ncbi:hypothetical protein A4A49_05454 [Nicotiana attenuata]|uniref:Uncharacterized protein n=1 Tax=Nicotiana attenuata TaxID=49451 RepID=A0A1J6IZZ0_NICAT|nr:hypothetical protein A4A49_05454 [Nicotiana attenuata]